MVNLLATKVIPWKSGPKYTFNNNPSSLARSYIVHRTTLIEITVYDLVHFSCFVCARALLKSSFCVK